MLKLTIVLVATLSFVLAVPLEQRQQFQMQPLFQWASWDFAPFPAFAPMPSAPSEMGNSVSTQYQSSNGFWEFSATNATHIYYTNSNGDKVTSLIEKFVKPGSQPSKVPGNQQQQSNTSGSQQQQSGSGTQIQIQG